MAHTTADIDAILVQMLKAWPSLRQTRLSALYEIARNSESRWTEDGDVFVPAGALTRSDTFRDDEETKFAGKRLEIMSMDDNSIRAKAAKQMLAQDIVRFRKDRADEEFIRENAELLIEARDHSFGEVIFRAGALRLLDNIPANANPLWVAVFVEMCEDIGYAKYPIERFHNHAEDYKKLYADDLEAAKAEAKEILIRLKGTDAEKQNQNRGAVQKKLQALLDEAARLGVKINAEVL